MLNVKIICIGKCKESYLKEACLEYQKRLSSFCKLEIIELAECKSNNPNESQIKEVIETEGDSILKKISNDSYNISLCIEGKQIPSIKLADKLSQLGVDGFSKINFIIGGSYGLSDKVKNISNLKLSMSEMTFPHQLARVMLLEQIYRAFSITAKTKYHK